MEKTLNYTTKGYKATEIILKLLEVHGLLEHAGHLITKPLEQSPARWKVLGAIDAGPLTVSQVARRMGIARQSVQRVANILRGEALIEFIPNMDHVNSPKLKLTHTGEKTLRKINQRQVKWANAIGADFSINELNDFLGFLHKFQEGLDKREDHIIGC